MNPKAQNKNKIFHSQSESGFTLIELLVVISIISFLASILLVDIAHARWGARDDNRVESVNQVSKALELYYNSNNSYPSGAYYSGWDDGNYPSSNAHCWCADAGTGDGLEQALVGTGVLAKLPEDPTPAEGTGRYLGDGTGRGYVYVSDGQNYLIGTYLEAASSTPPSANSTSTCIAGGNYQISSGSLAPSNCPAPYTPAGGQSLITQQQAIAIAVADSSVDPSSYDISASLQSNNWYVYLSPKQPVCNPPSPCLRIHGGNIAYVINGSTGAIISKQFGQ